MSDPELPLIVTFDGELCGFSYDEGRVGDVGWPAARTEHAYNKGGYGDGYWNNDMDYGNANGDGVGFNDDHCQSIVTYMGDNGL